MTEKIVTKPALEAFAGAMKDQLDGRVLSTWQQKYLSDLEEQEVKSKFAVTLAVSPASKEIDGTATSLTLTATVKYDGQPVEATLTSASGLTFTGSNGTYKATTTYAKPTEKLGNYSKSYSVTAAYTHDGTAMSKDASANFSLYAQSRILQTAGTDAPTSAVIAAATVKRRGITGTYDIVTEKGKYVWLCVPQGLTGVTKITSSGFGVPIEDPVNVDVAFGTQTVTYRCWRVSGAPQVDKMSVVVS